MILVSKSTISWAENNPNAFLKRFNLVENYQKSKKTPDSTIGFLEYGTRKIIVLGQKTSKNMNSVKMLIHGRRAIKSHFFRKNRLLKNIENLRKHLTLPYEF